MSCQVVDKADLHWWVKKVERRGVACFNSSVGDWAAHALTELVDLDKSSLATGSLEELAKILSVPQKYLTRSIASLTRCGVVRAHLHPSPVVELQYNVLRKRKGTAQATRCVLPINAKLNIFSSDGYVCAHCLQHFPYSQLHVDHIVPVSLLGADEPGNMVSMCKQCNADKSDKFIRSYLNQYRMVAVDGPIQLRFLSGYFWPVINGSVKRQTRREI